MADRAKAPVVSLSLGERFINWFPRETKLYLRGERGKGEEVVGPLYAEVAAQVSAFFGPIVDERARAIAADALEQTWIPVSLRLPDDDREVLVWCKPSLLDVPGKVYVAKARPWPFTWQRAYDGEPIQNVAHWRELPDGPPKED